METINGYVEHVIFQNSENGYTVMNLVVDGEEITCVGMCKGLSQGENIAAEGDYVEHPLYGKQFKMVTYRIEAPKDSVSMERYLASGWRMNWRLKSGFIQIRITGFGAVFSMCCCNLRGKDIPICHCPFFWNGREGFWVCPGRQSDHRLII